MQRDVPAILLLLGTLAPSVPWAHHGISRYDMDAVLVLEGTLEHWTWQSPHTALGLRVYADAEAYVWQIEGAPPGWMQRQGFSPKSLEPGETVLVTYHPARSQEGPWDGLLMEVERESGEVLKVNRPARLGGP